MNLVRRHIALLIRLVLAAAIALGSSGVRLSACPYSKPAKIAATKSCCVEKKSMAKDRKADHKKNCCGREDNRCCCMTTLLFVELEADFYEAPRASVPDARLTESPTLLPLDPPFHPPRG
jgi:hypothetical protein